jgi:hypothetical protein
MTVRVKQWEPMGVANWRLFFLSLDAEALKSSSITLPKHEVNVSDDVSLNIAVDQPEEEGLSPGRNVASQRNDDTINEERRVAFLPPPRMSVYPLITWICCLCML